MALEFGIFDHIEHMDEVPLHKLYRDRLDQVVAIEQAGFHGYHLAEHHSPSQHSMAPAQNVFLAAAAERTSTLRLGGCVYTLPFHHPLRLLEELCMLDHMSQGRLDIGLGRGGEIEAYYWGMGKHDDPDRAAINAELRQRYDEMLAILMSGFANERITFEGQYYQFDDLPMRLQPLQRPYPPTWYMRNVETAARHGMNAMVDGGLVRIGEDVKRYRETWAREQGEGALTAQGTEPKIGAVIWAVIAPTDEAATARIGPAWRRFMWNLRMPRRIQAETHNLTQLLSPTLAKGATGDGPPPAPPGPAANPERSPRAADGMFGSVLAGSPETIRGYLERYQATGANYIVLALQFGDITHREAMQSIELLATDVMPHFRS